MQCADNSRGTEALGTSRQHCSSLILAEGKLKIDSDAILPAQDPFHSHMAVRDVTSSKNAKHLLLSIRNSYKVDHVVLLRMYLST